MNDVAVAARALIDQLMAGGICPACDQDIGEGVAHEPGCELARLETTLDGLDGAP